jgi:hypothetical protein
VNRSLFVLEPSDETLEKIRDINFDSLFLSEEKFESDTLKRIKDLSINSKIYIDVPVFAGKELLDKYPDAIPMKADGETLDIEEYAGLCPTHEGVRKEVLNKIEKLLKENIDGIWLDFIRYPTKWEGEEPKISDTCYCGRCLQKFSEYLDEPIEGETLEDKYLLIDGAYYFEWLDFKTDQIASFVKEVRDLILASGKKIKLGAFIVPWKDDEYGQAIKRVVAQDFTKMFQHLDVFSPMLYHKMAGRSVDWVKEMVAYYWETGKPLLPLVQTEDKPKVLSDEEFKKALEFATNSPSQSVCVFFIDDLLNKPSKMKILKEFFIGY